MEEISKKEEVVNVVAETVKVDNSDVFVGENDVFEVVIKYYKENGSLLVESVDDSFKNDHADIKSVKIMFRYPSVKDAQSIVNAADSKMSVGDFSFIEMMKLQDVRILTLMKSWNLTKEAGDIWSLHTKILKAIRSKVVDVIGMDGII